MKGLQPSRQGPGREGVAELWHPPGAFLPAGIKAWLLFFSKAKEYLAQRKTERGTRSQCKNVFPFPRA